MQLIGNGKNSWTKWIARADGKRIKNICKNKNTLQFFVVESKSKTVWNFHLNLLAVMKVRLRVKLVHCCLKCDWCSKQRIKNMKNSINFDGCYLFEMNRRTEKSIKSSLWWSLAIIFRQFWFYTLLASFKLNRPHLNAVNQTANRNALALRCIRTAIIINHWTCVNLMRFRLIVIFHKFFFFFVFIHWLIALFAAIQCTNSKWLIPVLIFW